MADKISSLTALSSDSTLTNLVDTVDADEVNTHRTNYRTEINLQKEVAEEMDRNYASSSEPSLKSEGKVWCDTTVDPALMKYYKDGSSNLETFVGTTLTQTLTNKTLTSPTITYSTTGAKSTIGLAQDKNVLIVNNSSNPTYQIDITFDKLTLYDTNGLGAVETKTSAFTLDITSTGAGGRAIDVTQEGSASEQASKKYYAHIYSDGAGTINGILSVQADWADVASSDKPSGSDYVRSLSTAFAFNDSSSDFLTFRLENKVRNLHSEIILNQGNGHGSTNTNIRRFSTVSLTLGTGITYADTAAAGASLTINENGLYYIIYTDTRPSTNGRFGISLNSTQLTTNINNINAADFLCGSATSSTVSGAGSFSVTINLEVGDVIRPHTGGGMNGTTADNSNIFRIRRIM